MNLSEMVIFGVNLSLKPRLIITVMGIYLIFHFNFTQLHMQQVHLFHHPPYSWSCTVTISDTILLITLTGLSFLVSGLVCIYIIYILCI